ncbi:hypothetical protein MGN70_009002 [Eutypa lata]|nr:hypothetical protein MGN70_009002 [Eutypa lata]
MKSTIISTLLLLTVSASAGPLASKGKENSPRSGVKLSQAEASSRLSEAGITSYSTGGCTDRTNSHCTSYEGVYSGTVDGAITLKGACGCDLLITGGTETGHAAGTYSHANGYKFDFRKNDELDAYVTDTFARIADRGDGYPQWKSAAGNIYCVSIPVA